MKTSFEDNFVERKSASVKSQELRQTLVAFSNSLHERETAALFIGVHDKNGKILGVDDTDALQKRVGEAGEDCYPVIRPRMTVLQVEGKAVLAVEVESSSSKPHFAGPAYIRSGSRSIKASESLYKDLLTSHCSKAGELLRWKGKIVTVNAINKKLGNHYPNYDGSIYETYKCTVMECDPFSVTLHLDAAAERCVEPLDRVELDWDAKNRRRMITVRGQYE